MNIYGARRAKPPHMHGARFDAMCHQIREAMARKPWRTAMSPRTVLILGGVHKGLQTEEIVAACRAMYEDYAPVRACNKVLFRIFLRMLARVEDAQQPGPTE